MAGELIRLLLAYSEDDADYAGGVTGSDAAFSDEDELQHLSELRPLVVDGDTATQIVVGTFRPIARWWIRARAPW